MMILFREGGLVVDVNEAIICYVFLFFIRLIRGGFHVCSPGSHIYV